MKCLWLLALPLLAASFGAAAEPSRVLRGEHFPSHALGRDLAYDLYLPPDRAGLTHLPVITLLHGAEASAGDWLDKGDLQATADRLILSQALPAAIIVMPEAENSWYVDSPAGTGLGAMGTAIGEDLPAWIEARYGTLPAREGRAIAGYSMGGFGALRLALLPAGRYAAAASMSGAFWVQVGPTTVMPARMTEALRHIFEGSFGEPFAPARFAAESPLALARTLPDAAPRPAVLLISGRHEMFDAATEQTTVAHALEAARIPVETALTDGEHNWDQWRVVLPQVLTFLGQHLKAGEKQAAQR